MNIIGIDCAVQYRNVGIARSRLEGDVLRVNEVIVGHSALVDMMTEWLRHPEPTLISLDAPLGWSALLGHELVRHRAGEALATRADWMFRRVTDDIVYGRLGKRSLDVGADRIARTCHAALSLIGEIRSRTGLRIPLAWDPGVLEETSAMECYPAATLLGRGVEAEGYKVEGNNAVRAGILRALYAEVEVAPDVVPRAVSCDHAIDAILCALAGADFLKGDVERPVDPVSAAREGWIWFCKRSVPVVVKSPIAST